MPVGPVGGLCEGLLPAPQPGSRGHGLSGNEDFVHGCGRLDGPHFGEGRAQDAASCRLHGAVTRASDEVHREHAPRGNGPPQVSQQLPVHGLCPEDVGPSGQINIIHDHVKSAVIRPQPGIGIANNDFDPGRVECHVPAGQANHLPVDIERGESAGGQEMAQNAQSRPAGEAKHEQRARFFTFPEEGGGCEHVPDQAGQKTMPVMEGMHGASHAKLGGEGRLPDFEILVGSAHSRHAS